MSLRDKQRVIYTTPIKVTTNSYLKFTVHILNLEHILHVSHGVNRFIMCISYYYQYLFAAKEYWILFIRR